MDRFTGVLRFACQNLQIDGGLCRVNSSDLHIVFKAGEKGRSRLGIGAKPSFVDPLDGLDIEVSFNI